MWSQAEGAVGLVSSEPMGCVLCVCFVCVSALLLMNRDDQWVQGGWCTVWFTCMDVTLESHQSNEASRPSPPHFPLPCHTLSQSCHLTPVVASQLLHLLSPTAIQSPVYSLHFVFWALALIVILVYIDLHGWECNWIPSLTVVYIKGFLGDWNGTETETFNRNIFILELVFETCPWLYSWC